jgi:hypothetical protein
VPSEKDYMDRASWPAYSAIAGFACVSLACFATLALRHAHVPSLPMHIELPRIEVVAHLQRAVPLDYFGQLRAQVHWVPTKVGRELLPAPDFESRMLLARSAADRAGLKDLGLSYKDVYAIINAETSWVPRRGSSRDGTPNLGLAQFEPATARALGLQDPDDPVEAVHAAAMHMRDAALWSRDRLRGLRLGKAQQAEKLREGISVYYNLSTRGRNHWNGLNTAQLPIETQRHIANARLGAQEAEMLEAQLRIKAFAKGRELLTANAADPRS